MQPRVTIQCILSKFCRVSKSIYKHCCLFLTDKLSIGLSFYVTYLQACNFKAFVRYLLSNFYFSPNDSPSKTMKNVFLFHIKRSFRSRDI